MKEFSLTALPEVFLSRSEISAGIYSAVKQNKVRKLAAKIYTTNLLDSPEQIIRRNLWSIVALLYPGAVISERSGFDLAPAADGSLFVISAKRKSPSLLPGLRIYPRIGMQALASDRPFLDGLMLASPARIFLENLRPSRARAGHIARTLSRTEVEEKLEQILRTGGEKSLNDLRDQARHIAVTLELEKESKELDAIIGAMLGTRRHDLASPLTTARARGEPYDPNRQEFFEVLFRELKRTAVSIRPQPSDVGMSTDVLPFFEAYFSNFIEGTEFDVEEAQEIVFRNIIPSGRPADAHDIIGTFELVSSLKEMSRVPKSPEEFFALLRSRHQKIMRGRIEKRPGEFKQRGNRAGSTQFVTPELVEGTFRQGWKFYRLLEDAFQRAVFMMFLISEVHPFDDGNGRCARVFMNAELVACRETRILIPIIYRTNYVQALKALSLNKEPAPLLRTLDFAQRFTAAVDWRSMDAAHAGLTAGNAFLDPIEADREGKRLRLPEIFPGDQQ
jgi:hypothetical protein